MDPTSVNNFMYVIDTRPSAGIPYNPLPGNVKNQGQYAWTTTNTFWLINLYARIFLLSVLFLISLVICINGILPKKLKHTNNIQNHQNPIIYSPSHRLNNKLDLNLLIFLILHLLLNFIQSHYMLLFMQERHSIGIQVNIKYLLVQFQILVQRYIWIYLEFSFHARWGYVRRHHYRLFPVGVEVVNVVE